MICTGYSYTFDLTYNSLQLSVRHKSIKTIAKRSIMTDVIAPVKYFDTSEEKWCFVCNRSERVYDPGDDSFVLGLVYGLLC